MFKSLYFKSSLFLKIKVFKNYLQIFHKNFKVYQFLFLYMIFFMEGNTLD